MKLLDERESSWIDFKAELDPALEHKTSKDKDDWEKGKGKLLKDLMALANASVARRERHLIRGVKDRTGRAEVVGVQKSFDDAEFQGWNQNTFHPPLVFEYRELWLDGKLVGVFTIQARTEVPHTVKVRVADVLYPGQVWTRLGSKNTLAMGEMFQQLVKPIPPRFRVGIPTREGQDLLKVTLGPVEDEAFRAAKDMAHSSAARALQELQAAIRDFDPAVDTRDVPILERFQERHSSDQQKALSARVWTPLAYPDRRKQVIRQLLTELSLPFDEDMLECPGLLTTRESVKDTDWQHMPGMVLGGAGFRWMMHLEELIAVHQAWSQEWTAARQRRLNPQLSLAVRNEGPGMATGVELTLRVRPPVQFFLPDLKEEKQGFLGKKKVKRNRNVDEFQFGASVQELHVRLPDLPAGKRWALGDWGLKRHNLGSCLLECCLMSRDWPEPQIQQLQID